MLDEILQRIDEGNGLPEKTLKIETQSHIDDTDIHSVPDGLISCNYAFNIYIESKLSDVINLTQLENLGAIASTAETPTIATHRGSLKLGRLVWINAVNKITFFYSCCHNIVYLKSKF